MPNPWKLILSLFLFAVCVPNGQAAAVEPLHEQVLAPYIGPQTVVIARVELERVQPAAVLDWLTATFPDQAAKAGTYKPTVESMHQALLQAGMKYAYWLGSVNDLPDQAGVVVIPLADDADRVSLKTLLKMIPTVELREQQHHLAVALPQTWQRLANAKAVTRPEFAAAWKAIEAVPVQCCFAPTADHRRVIEELLPTMSSSLGNRPSTVLTEGCRWLALSIGLPDELSLKVVLHGKNQAAAEKLRDYFQELFQQRQQELLSQIATADETTVLVERIASMVLQHWQLRVDRANLIGELKDPAKLFQRIRQPAWPLAQRKASEERLQQLGYAMLNHHVTHQRFPSAAIPSEDGKPLLSWRVRLLPFLEEEELYEQFHLDEPWDSEHNRKLLAKMPKIFQKPSAQLKPGHTCFLVPVGPGAAFEGEQGMKIAQIPDGTTRTILMLELPAEQAVPWTKPADYTFDPEKPTQGLGPTYGNEIPVLFVDTKVRFLSLDQWDADDWKAAFTRAGKDSFAE